MSQTYTEKIFFEKQNKLNPKIFAEWNNICKFAF
jgi:hypothetical protein